MVARTDPWKGHELFVRAATHVHGEESATTFLIVGLDHATRQSSGIYSRITEMIREASLEGVVLHSPTVESAREIMRYSDVVVVPSSNEGFGRVAVEAMAEETAVVASDVGGLAEIITHRKDGLLFPYPDVAVLAEHLLLLLRDDKLRGKLARNGHQAVRERFTVGRTVESVDRHLTDLLFSAPAKR
jgi:glycosyltransferase involved in cell wall biosynthesis